jgi:hypothetical protein
VDAWEWVLAVLKLEQDAQERVSVVRVLGVRVLGVCVVGNGLAW